MDYPLIIVFRGNRIVQMSSTAYHSWFPSNSQPTWDRSIDAEQWVDLIERLGGRTNVRRVDIRDTLHSLFECLKRRIHHVVGEARMRVAEHLDNQLRSDLASNSVWVTDLSRTRRQFVVLSCFARLMNSELLAQALSNFLSNAFDDIKRHERAEYLYSEWYPATKTVKGLIPGDMNYALIHQFQHTSHHPWDDRGRATRALAPPVYEPRALSAPGTRRSTRSVRLIGFPHTMMTHMPPMMSPIHLLHADPLNEVGALHWKQEEMAARIDGLERDVDEVKEGGWWW